MGTRNPKLPWKDADESGRGIERSVLAGDTRMLIDGELVNADAMFEVIDPASAQIAGVASDDTTEDMDRAAGVRDS